MLKTEQTVGRKTRSYKVKRTVLKTEYIALVEPSIEISLDLDYHT